MHITTVAMEDELWQRIQRAAYGGGLSVSQWVSEAATLRLKNRRIAA